MSETTPPKQIQEYSDAKLSSQVTMPPDTGKVTSDDPEDNEVQPTNAQHPSLSSEEEEDDDPTANGYQLLVDTTGDVNDSEGEDDLRVRAVIRRLGQELSVQQSLQEPEDKNETQVQAEAFELSRDASEEIKSVMKRIQLPSTSFPEWAQVIPEDNWKSVLDSKIKDKLGHNSKEAD